MRRIKVLLPLVNIIGAVATYFYFSFILKSVSHPEHIPSYYPPLFFAGGTAALVFMFNISHGKSVKALFKVAAGESDIRSMEEPEVHHLQRQALQFPLTVSVVSFLVWILAGF